MPFTGLVCFMMLFTVSIAQGQVLLKGNFASFANTEFRIVHDQSVVNDFRGEQLASGKTNGSGEMSATVTLLQEQPVMLFIGGQFMRLWLNEQGTIEIQERDQRFSFKGNAEKENTFLYKAGIMQPLVPGTIVSNKFEPQKQLHYLDSLEEKRWNLYKEMFGIQQTSRRFYAYCQGEINHFTFFSKNQYPLRFIYMDKTVKFEDIPADYFSFWNSFRLLDDDCKSDMYNNGLRDFISFIGRKKTGADSDGSEAAFREQFNIIDSLLAQHPHTQERQRADLMMFLIRYFDYKNLVLEKLEQYKQSQPHSLYTLFIQKEWNKKNKITLSTPSFALKDVNGRAMDIKNFRGKFVYIDFWGSWCKPCMAQMPYSSLLQDKYRDKNIVFLFINFYDTRNKWLTAIKTAKIKGVHVKAEKADEQYFYDMFGVRNGFPRYALIDATGVLLTNSAPHPGSKDIFNFLDAHLSR
jgi:thiol-disulfide isomerase/thioredoxin